MFANIQAQTLLILTTRLFVREFDSSCFVLVAHSYAKKRKNCEFQAAKKTHLPMVCKSDVSNVSIMVAVIERRIQKPQIRSQVIFFINSHNFMKMSTIFVAIN